MHRNLTPAVWIKFLGRMLGGTMMIAAASTAAAQETPLPNYLGPGVATPGAGDLGSRSGEQVGLRYFLGVSGIMNSNLQPFALDSQGNLVRVHNLYGVEVNGGAYGVHHWKRAQLGLDYSGNYQRYINSNTYNGSNQNLTLGYTAQPTRRWILDLRETVGTLAIATSERPSTQAGEILPAFTPAALVFDSRTTFLQSSAYATYLQSARNSFTFGGSGFLQDQKAFGLSNSWGYTLTGSGHRRMTKAATVGVSYSHSHYEFPSFHSFSDSNSYHGTFATGIGRFWTFSLEAGVTVSEVNSQLTFTLNPVLAALFGVPTVTQNVYTRTTYPSGAASLERKFRRASLTLNYSRGLGSGNGLTSTSRQDNASMSFSYTGIRRVNLGVNGGHYTLVSIGQNTGSFATFTGSAGFTYLLGHNISMSARYDVNQQEIDLGNYNRVSTRATLGLLFSPGAIPLALW